MGSTAGKPQKQIQISKTFVHSNPQPGNIGTKKSILVKKSLAEKDSTKLKGQQLKPQIIPAIKLRTNNSDVNKEEKKIFNQEKGLRKAIAAFEIVEGQSQAGAASTDSASSSNKGNTPQNSTNSNCSSGSSSYQSSMEIDISKDNLEGQQNRLKKNF